MKEGEVVSSTEGNPGTVESLAEDLRALGVEAGSILLDVEKRNVQHFEVETPYLAAVVKGTQFRVTVGPTGSRVERYAPGTSTGGSPSKTR